MTCLILRETSLEALRRPTMDVNVVEIPADAPARLDSVAVQVVPEITWLPVRVNLGTHRGKLIRHMKKRMTGMMHRWISAVPRSLPDFRMCTTDTASKRYQDLASFLRSLETSTALPIDPITIAGVAITASALQDIVNVLKSTIRHHLPSTTKTVSQNNLSAGSSTRPLKPHLLLP